jgi:hypothetical protein
MVVGLVIQAGASVAPAEVIGGGFFVAEHTVGGGFGHWRESSGVSGEVARERDTKVGTAVCLVNRAIENISRRKYRMLRGVWRDSDMWRERGREHWRLRERARARIVYAGF